MPPREDETMMIATPAPVTASLTHSPSSQPNLFELPKDIAFLEIQQPSLSVRERMESSLERASARATEMKARMTRDDFQAKSPFVYEACQSALLEEMSRKLGQASLLLEDAKQEDKDVTQTTKDKRLSVALINTLQYLDTLESAMAFSSRDRLEASLRLVLDSITRNGKEDIQDALNVCVSSWKAPSLAFDFRVGRPATLSVGSSAHEPLSLPIDLEVKAIMEYSADELIQNNNLQLPRDAGVFAVSVKKCHHEQKKNVPREGIVGEAMVQIHIAPLAETKLKKKEAVWGVNEDVEKIRIKEVRA